MAKATLETITLLHATASRISASNQYQWGHMGLCNCGFLAQQISHLSKEEIHSRAMERYGDWNEQLIDYCPTSGLPMDHLIGIMLESGFSIDDLKHLERLSDPSILRGLPLSEPCLRHNIKEDVVKYLKTWACLLELEWIETIKIDEAETTSLSLERQIVK